MPDQTVRRDVQQLLTYLDTSGFPPIQDQTPADARASFAASQPAADLPAQPLETVVDLVIPGPGGDLPARLLDARADRAAGPIVVWFHGGGFVTGGIASHTSLASQVAIELDLPVVLIDYRLAPEARFPAAHDDAESAARWLASNPADFPGSVDGLVLAGDSAGGSLAITTSLALRDRPAEVPVLAHLAIYPATDAAGTYASRETYAEGYLLTEAGRLWYDSHVRPVPEDRRASPLRADLAGLPPAVVMTAGLDPIRDEGRAYAAALIQAGVATTFLEAVGNIHAFVLMRKAIPSSVGDIRRVLRALRTTLQELPEVGTRPSP